MEIVKVIERFTKEEERLENIIKTKEEAEQQLAEAEKQKLKQNSN